MSGALDKVTPILSRTLSNRLKILSLFLTGLLIIVAGAYLYYQSNTLKQEGDIFLKYGKAAEALDYYEKAQKTNPLNLGLANDIEGAKLVLQSSLDVGSISQYNAELQNLPPLSQLPANLLSPNELFVPILMYHYVRINPNPNDLVGTSLSVSPDQLEQQLSYLNSHNYHSITLDDLLDVLNGKTTLPEKPIILTFDDGYRDLYTNGFPLLKKYQIKAESFVITRSVGLKSYLTWDQIVEMDKSGLVQFGAHTEHHPNLPDLPPAAIIEEIKGSKADLEKYLKKTVNWFCYPYGSYSGFIIQTVKNAGFKGAISTVYGAAQSLEKLYLLPRIRVDGQSNLDNLIQRVQP